jgi:chromate reductase
MITIVSATNRHDSMTLKMANIYYKLFSGKTKDVHLISLENKNVWERSEDLQELEKKYFIPSGKFVFIMPEYNGSFPGIFKVMLDNSDIKKCWWFKKAMLVGIADGRGGNLRGLDHITNILHYLKMHVFYNKLPFSRINDEMDKEGILLKPQSLKVINEQVDEFLNY